MSSQISATAISQSALTTATVIFNAMKEILMAFVKNVTTSPGKAFFPGTKDNKDRLYVTIPLLLWATFYWLVGHKFLGAEEEVGEEYEGDEYQGDEYEYQGEDPTFFGGILGDVDEMMGGILGDILGAVTSTTSSKTSSTTTPPPPPPPKTSSTTTPPPPPPPKTSSTTAAKPTKAKRSKSKKHPGRGFLLFLNGFKQAYVAYFILAHLAMPSNENLFKPTLGYSRFRLRPESSGYVPSYYR